MTIDMVIPYVDNKDEVWKKTYLDFCKKYNLRLKIAELHTCRFDDIGLINYQLKLVEKNMPFINKIYLLVSNIEQVPSDINKDKVVVVLHKDFIPYHCLPIFNSCAIEMYLWNIPNLSEYFIYANDDMLPCGELKESDFFENGKIRIKWLNDDISVRKNTQFKYQCLNGYRLINNLKCDTTQFIRPVHSFTPMIKSHCKETYDTHRIYIEHSISRFRTYENYNQYIYPLYELKKYGTLESDIDFYYTENEVDINHQIVCINKVPNGKEQEIKYKLGALL